MTHAEALKAKLGLDVFKPGGEPHIRIIPGMEKDHYQYSDCPQALNVRAVSACSVAG